jgi:hypothetical protein
MERLPDELSVREGRDRYLTENGFTTTEYEAPTFRVKVMGHGVPLPNPRSRRDVIPLHDLHPSSPATRPTGAARARSAPGSWGPGATRRLCIS